MIQTALSFILGFLSAAFLALMIAPAVWRRAVRLTRNRVEASLPLTMDQIQADKDHIRAEFAMSARKLEMSIKPLKEKTAIQAVEISRLGEELKGAVDDARQKAATIAALETHEAQTQATLAAREAEIRQLSESVAALRTLADQRAVELETLGRMHDEASFTASSRQIEIAAQEAKLEKQAEDLAALREERKQARASAKEVAAEIKSLRGTLRAREKELKLASERLERQAELAVERGNKLDVLDRLHKEAAALASSHENELAARNATLERLTADFAALGERHRQQKEREVAATGEITSLRETLLAREDELRQLSERLAETLTRAEEDARNAAAERESLQEALRAARTELEERLTEHERLASERLNELDRLERAYQEAKLKLSTRDVDFAAQQAQIDRLSAEAATLRHERKQAAVLMRETGSQNRTLQEALRVEQRKTEALEKKSERLIASLAEHEERLERRERELARLREQTRGATTTPPKQTAAEGVAAGDQARLQERLEVLARENRKLREALAGHGRDEAPDSGQTVLREQISDLAAEVVHLTAMLDGTDVNLRETLDDAASSERGARPQSLADRIRALQEAASTR